MTLKSSFTLIIPKINSINLPKLGRPNRIFRNSFTHSLNKNSLVGKPLNVFCPDILLMTTMCNLLRDEKEMTERAQLLPKCVQISGSIFVNYQGRLATYIYAVIKIQIAASPQNQYTPPPKANQHRLKRHLALNCEPCKIINLFFIVDTVTCSEDVITL